MAANVNIFEKFGIKEVANVYFEALDDNLAFGEKAGDIVLFLDTLKVSTIETTAENVAAQGGWGNPKLVMWDYGKEINLTLEDALLSLESARIMLGGKIKNPANGADKVEVHYTAEITANPTEDGALVAVAVTNPSTKNYFRAADLGDADTDIRFINVTQGYRGSASVAVTDEEVDEKGNVTVAAKATYTLEGNGEEEVVKGDKIRLFWTVVKEANSEGNSAVEITISPDTFPGTYKIVGDTFMRSEKTGKDQPFQFVINKAKVLSEVTITMEAEGDPSTFEMSINVLRDDSGEMMKMIRYAE